MKYLLSGFLLTLGLIGVMLALPIGTADVLAMIVLQPSSALMNSLPGGKENPFNLIVIVIVQTITYAIVLRLIFGFRPPAENLSVRQEGQRTESDEINR